MRILDQKLPKTNDLETKTTGTLELILRPPLLKIRKICPRCLFTDGEEEEEGEDRLG